MVILFSTICNHQLNLPPRNLSILRNFAQNVRNVYLGFGIFAQELCNLRKIMLEGECKLEKFTVRAEREMGKSFVKECFGVTIEEVRNDSGKISTMIYRTSDESIE
ncbi:hypothetical protein PENTCL1PPCAC_20544, partial [Pristionchus entomophagus]